MKDALISILMPAYNAERHIAEAIGSVLAQTYGEWELLVVDDGSTDRTWDVIMSFNDPRIRAFRKANQGIGSARNMALENMRGSFVCGLDSDDVMPPNSLAARMAIFKAHPDTAMVDGVVLFMDGQLQHTIRNYEPRHEGDPSSELARLTGSCFMGFSWLLRWPKGSKLRFRESISHGEDLLFYLEYSPGRTYRYTKETVLIYRRTGVSVMTDLAGLERSYQWIGRWLWNHSNLSLRDKFTFLLRRKRIVAASYGKAGRWGRALLAFLR